MWSDSTSRHVPIVYVTLIAVVHLKHFSEKEYFRLRKKIIWRCLRLEWWRRNADPRGRKWQDNGKNFMNTFIICNPYQYFSGNHIKDEGLYRRVVRIGEKKNNFFCCKNLNERENLGQRLERQDNKIDLKEETWEGMIFFVSWGQGAVGAVVHAVMTFPFTYITEKFLTTWGANGFSKRALSSGGVGEVHTKFELNIPPEELHYFWRHDSGMKQAPKISPGG
jgi:hypothetical protein